ncbi:2Fe-2S iron-sulfur cluster-binding protein [Massilia cavernae]|uniref:Ferredoxin n=1 Tax=Massilia cavernae TaxID=2320864 RepID=A0A418XG34_9BURK|nr:2Fe-2S iron-sulfur cluster-binding protein [Massilia cavernae]RJG11433.1 ferredoxin [Massilia cavernae]
MSTIKIRLRSNEELEINTANDLSLMEAMREAGVDEMRALCGGCCSCATCHVYVVQGSPELAVVNDLEDAMLSSILYRKEGSRLACQIPVTQTCEGLVVEIAPEE